MIIAIGFGAYNTIQNISKAFLLALAKAKFRLDTIRAMGVKTGKQLMINPFIGIPGPTRGKK